MNNFNNKLSLAIIALCETTEPSDNRPILIGRHELMEQLIAGLKDSGESTEITRKASHPEVPDHQLSHSMNPDLLVTLDQHSKFYGTGTNNCITCRHFIPDDLCPRWQTKGKEVFLSQQIVSKLSVGNCILQQLVPGLADEQPNGITYPNDLFDEIVEKVLDDDKVVVYKNGQYKELDYHDVGIEDPHLRSKTDYVG